MFIIVMMTAGPLALAVSSGMDEKQSRDKKQDFYPISGGAVLLDEEGICEIDS